MTKNHLTRHSALIATLALTGVALVASGCHHHRPPCHAHRHHPDKAEKRSIRGDKHRHHRVAECHCGKKGKVGKKAHRLGAPKLISVKMLKAHAQWLGLTSEQVTAIDAIKKEHRTAKKAFALQKKRALMALKMEWLQDQPDPAKIRDLVKAFLAVKQAVVERRTETLLKLKETLTPEQYQKLLSKRGHHGRTGCCKGAADAGCCKGAAGAGCCKGTAGADCCKGAAGKGCCKGAAGKGCCKGAAGKGCCKGAAGAGCCRGHGHGPHGHGPHGHGPQGHGPQGKTPGAPCPHCVK